MDTFGPRIAYLRESRRNSKTRDVIDGLDVDVEIDLEIESTTQNHQT